MNISERQKVIFWILAIFICWRLGTLAASWYSHPIIIDHFWERHAPKNYPDLPENNLMEIQMRWDSNFYAFIAKHGYQSDTRDYNLAFFPLLPTLAYPLTKINISPYNACWIIANLAAFLAILGLFIYSTMLLSFSQSQVSIISLMLFPTSFFLLMPYTESLLIMCFCWSLFYHHQNHTIKSGLLAALAISARPTGIVLSLAYIVHAIYALVFNKKGGYNSLICGIFGLLMGIAILSTLFIAWGESPTSFIGVQKYWGRTGFQLPWDAIITSWHDFIKDFPRVSEATSRPQSYYFMIRLGELIFFLFSLLLLPFIFKKLGALLGFLSLGLLFMPLCSGSTMSLMRFAAVNVPLFMVIGKILDDQSAAVKTSILVFAAPSSGLLMIMYCNWYFVG